ncbi:MAG: PAS domain-containing protein [Desulfobulbaceae bacterium]|nr:PAS domain-containing protein [Desulfobulbaceae bacterium]
MTWLAPSIIASLMGSLILTGIFFYLYSYDRRRFLRIWATAWLIYAARYGFMLLLISPRPILPETLLTIANQLASLISGILLLWGSYVFIQKSLPRAWLFFALIDAGWISAASLVGFSFYQLTIPTFFFLGAVFIWTGIIIHRHFDIRGIGRNFTALVFILWGIHKFDYPFLRPVEWFAPWGYLIAASLEITVAIGMLLIYFQANREALQKSEERFDLAVRGANDGLWDWEDIERDEQWWSPRIYEMTGYAPGEFEAAFSALKKLIHPEDKPQVLAAIKEHLEKKSPYDVQFRLKNKSGEYRWYRARGQALYNHEKKATRMSGSLQDITELKNLLTQLQMAKFSIEKTALLIFWTNGHGDFIYVNEHTCATLGYSRQELLNLNILDIDPDFTGERWQQHWLDLQQKGTVRIQTRLRRKDGAIFPVEVTTNFHSYEGADYNFAYAMDISDRQKAEEDKQRLEEHIRRSQKIEAIGTLAGGIAHDFNNLLGVMLGYADIAKDDTPPGSELAEDLDKILTAGYRARDLVHQILAFSRQTQTERIALQPQPIIKEAIKLLRAALPASIAIRDVIDPHCGTIDADPTQLHQIVMNLCTNAFHAMEATGGVLSVELAPAVDVPEELAREPENQGKSFIRLTVSDTGPGIGPDIIDKIFDPFFTTKDPGKGTGMGLAIIYGIVHDYGGTVSVESRLGQGTTVHVYIPLGQRPLAAAETQQSEIAGGEGHILFVDDEELLVQMGRTMLQRLGYTVTVRSNSIDALETFQNQPERFDLVITDQTMPGMTGVDLSRRMLQIRPDIPIILCTGFSNLIDEETAKSMGIKEFAMKPLTRHALADLVAKALHGSTA